MHDDSNLIQCMKITIQVNVLASAHSGSKLMSNKQIGLTNSLPHFTRLHMLGNLDNKNMMLRHVFVSPSLRI